MPIPRPDHADADGAADRVGALRGAGVQVDARRLGRVALVLVVVILGVLSVVFAVVGINKNDQIDELHSSGVPVTFTVEGCLGLLGGSGSNAAGYFCHGTYVLDGHRYSEPLPGTSFYRPGAAVHALAVPGNPSLVSPVTIADSERTSNGLFVVSAVLGVLFVAGVVWIVVLWRRDRRTPVRQDGGV